MLTDDHWLPSPARRLRLGQREAPVHLGPDQEGRGADEGEAWQGAAGQHRPRGLACHGRRNSESQFIWKPLAHRGCRWSRRDAPQPRRHLRPPRPGPAEGLRARLRSQGQRHHPRDAVSPGQVTSPALQPSLQSSSPGSPVCTASATRPRGSGRRCGSGGSSGRWRTCWSTTCAGSRRRAGTGTSSRTSSTWSSLHT